MKFAFLGEQVSFDYFKIGGCESLARRMASGLLKEGHRVDFVIYGARAVQYRVAGPGIGLYYFVNLKDALNTIAREHDQVLTIYLRPYDRPSYMRFRRLNRHRLRFHQFFFAWPDSPIKRQAAFLEARLYPFNGRLFCISPRIFKYVSTWSSRALFFLPPVPENYFLVPEDKPKHDKIRVTYIGRTESGKGIKDVINLFGRLKGNPEIEVELHGFHHQHVPDSVKIHEWLEQQKDILYFYTPLESYSPKVDDHLRSILRDTDILVLPYSKLSSTIDTPLLLLEGMASLCAIITKSMGDIPRIYGPSPFLLSETGNMAEAAQCVMKAREILDDERRRIRLQNENLGFGLNNVMKQLIHI